MIKPEEAPKRAYDELKSEYWGDREGTFIVADVDLEDATDYCVSAGAKEWFVDGNPAFISIDDTFFFMNKETGELRRASMSNDDDVAKLEAMSQIYV
ncbi:hypothetical protein SEA_EASTWEST_5 [Arthrobacter phage EastWest]|uniref:Uncharacterized protein n=1 Tax=Arthrobacter phage EastWest TaxID=2894292 RepID=A0AAE9C959_9CAUD|nr:hypothetical protein SEA_EASTWEST_5 [Arthrobacter phage EastWest]